MQQIQRESLTNSFSDKAVSKWWPISYLPFVVGLLEDVQEALERQSFDFDLVKFDLQNLDATNIYEAIETSYAWLEGVDMYKAQYEHWRYDKHEPTTEEYRELDRMLVYTNRIKELSWKILDSTYAICERRLDKT